MTKKQKTSIKVAIIMGSASDWETMKEATVPLSNLGIAYEAKVVSAHRTPRRLYEFASQAHLQGIRIIIAGAGGSAHLAGMAAALTHLPVIAVPVTSRHLQGLDSLLSMVQMPRGVAVATQAIGEAGAFNAGLLAAQILALQDEKLEQRLLAWRQSQTDSIPLNVK
jgi:5-(carboxyamino)imidazole ribonucleotide mutase